MTGWPPVTPADLWTADELPSPPPAETVVHTTVAVASALAALAALGVLALVDSARTTLARWAKAVTR